jgi:hypothetical protein
LDETLVKGYHRKGKPGRRLAVRKIVGRVGCSKDTEHHNIRVALTEVCSWSVMLPFCCLCVPPDGVSRKSKLVLLYDWLGFVVHLVYSDGAAVYAVPSKWKAEGANRISHRVHDHNDPVHPFCDPVDRDLNSNRVESMNSLLKTTCLFPARGSYEPHLNSVVQEFAYHRKDENTSLSRYVCCVYFHLYMHCAIVL